MELHWKENSQRDENANEYIPEAHRLLLEGEQAGCVRDSLSLREDSTRAMRVLEMQDGAYSRRSRASVAEQMGRLARRSHGRFERPDERSEHIEQH